MNESINMRRTFFCAIVLNSSQEKEKNLLRFTLIDLKYSKETFLVHRLIS